MSASTPWTERSRTNASEDALVASIRSLVDVNSGSTNLDGITQVQAMLAEMMGHLGRVDSLEPAGVTGIDQLGHPVELEVGPSQVLRIRPEAEKRILIMGHADTVFGLESDFQTSWIEGDHLRGPGAADMKGGLVIAIAALTILEEAKAIEGVGLDLMISGDEETGSLASASSIDELAKRASVGLALEPPMGDGAMARARAGSANLTLVISGRSAHAGRALDEGRSAVLAASEVALIIADLEANVASIHGGEQFNSVPDRCVVRVNRRGLDSAEIDAMIATLDRECRRIESERDVTIERFGHQHRPAKPWTDESQALSELAVEAAGASGRELRFVDTRGVCDGNNMAASGLGVLDTIGIQGANIHTPDEYAVIAGLHEQVGFVAGLLELIAAREGAK